MEDKWYVSVNGHSDPTVYNLESVEEILKDSRSEEVYVIHVTQTPIDGLEGWVKLQPNDAPTLKKSFTKDQENQESLVDGKFDAEKEVDEVFYGNEEPLGSFGLERIKKMGLSTRCYFISGFMLILSFLFHLGYKKDPKYFRYDSSQYELQMRKYEDYRFARNSTLFLAVSVFIAGFLITGKKSDSSDSTQGNDLEMEFSKRKPISKKEFQNLIINKMIQKNLLIAVGGIFIVFILDSVIPARGNGAIYKGLVVGGAAVILIPLIQAGKLFYFKSRIQKELD